MLEPLLQKIAQAGGGVLNLGPFGYGLFFFTRSAKDNSATAPPPPPPSVFETLS